MLPLDLTGPWRVEAGHSSGAWHVRSATGQLVCIAESREVALVIAQAPDAIETLQSYADGDRQIFRRAELVVGRASGMLG